MQGVSSAGGIWSLKLVMAQPTGLCFGVRRAIAELESALLKYRKVFSLGSPIHNPQEVARLVELGLSVVDSTEQIPPDSVTFIRAHGLGPDDISRLEARSCMVVDGTCPFVRAAQLRARFLSQEGYLVVVVGDRSHPEVQGILGHVKGKAWVVSPGESLLLGDPKGRVGVLSQTTQRETALKDVVSRLVSSFPEVRVYNTICRATMERQEAVKDLAKQVDGMVVIGGRDSANTKVLADCAKEAGVQTLWIEHPDEIEWGWFSEKGEIGIAAGGSTPDWLIQEVVLRLSQA